MLAEKFILVLETIISRRSQDCASGVVSNSPYVPVSLPATGLLKDRSSRCCGPNQRM
jgi:hypothetical protein